MVKALSYSALKCFEEDRDEFYLRYLAKTRPPRPQQKIYGAIGSAFDAFVKHELGVPGLFERQVEVEWERAAVAGAELLDAYVRSGALCDLQEQLEYADDTVIIEGKLTGEVDGIPLTGYPDLMFDRASTQFTFDWKVKGYTSKSGASPTPGYQNCDGKPHARYLAETFGGVEINAGPLETFNRAYADQLSIYTMMRKGGPCEFVAMIDELVCRPSGIRVAQHRSTVLIPYQLNLVDRLKTCWDAVQTGYLFTELEYTDNLAKCERLDEIAEALATGDPAFNEVVRA